MTRALYFLLLISAFCLGAGRLAAQPASDAERCASITGNPDLAIQHCTRAIESGKFSGDPLSRLRISRGAEWAVKGDYARAIADYDAAIELGPKSSMALLGRGRARFYSGDFRRAASDMEQSMKAEPNEYTALWLYLARKRGGADDAEEALDRDTRATRGGWPSPVVLLYLGRTDFSSVLAASTDRDPKRQRDQRCEANFYLAQWHLLRNERDRALALLKEALEGCSKDFLEYEGTLAELRRLQKP